MSTRKVLALAGVIICLFGFAFNLGLWLTDGVAYNLPLIWSVAAMYAGLYFNEISE